MELQFSSLRTCYIHLTLPDIISPNSGQHKQSENKESTHFGDTLCTGAAYELQGNHRR